MTVHSYLGRRLAVAVMLFLRCAMAEIAPHRACAVVVRASALLARRSTWVACGLLVPLAAQANQFAMLDYNLTVGSRGRDTVFFELFDDKPVTSTNFMNYVNGGNYDGMFMHRLSHGFVMQGGAFYPEYQEEPTIPSFPWSLKSTSDVQVDLDGNPATANPEIVNEYSVGTTRSNVRGTLAMARRSGQPNSASSQWFVNYKDTNNFLDGVDGGFTVFGQVRGDGMNYYDALDTLATAENPGGMYIANLNQDLNDNGVRDSGVFYNPNAIPPGSDGVPLLGNQRENLVIVEKAIRIDYYGGTGSSTTLNLPAGGYTISARDVFFDTGATLTGTGSFSIGAGRTLGTREGFTINRTVNNAGTLAPGLQTGILNVAGFHQGTLGTLAIDLRGPTVDTEYDRLAVTGHSQLAGKLKVSLIDGFEPEAAQSFTFMTANTIAGFFDTVELPTLDNGLVWHVAQGVSDYSLTVVRADYNENGVVDAADYTLWRNTLGSVVPQYSAADGDGSGTINMNDFLVWRNHFGLKSASSAGAGAGGVTGAGVPEPSSAVLVVLAALVWGSAAIRDSRSR